MCASQQCMLFFNSIPHNITSRSNTAAMCNWYIGVRWPKSRRTCNVCVSVCLFTRFFSFYLFLKTIRHSYILYSFVPVCKITFVPVSVSVYAFESVCVSSFPAFCLQAILCSLICTCKTLLLRRWRCCGKLDFYPPFFFCWRRK